MSGHQSQQRQDQVETEGDLCHVLVPLQSGFSGCSGSLTTLPPSWLRLLTVNFPFMWIQTAFTSQVKKVKAGRVEVITPRGEGWPPGRSFSTWAPEVRDTFSPSQHRVWPCLRTVWTQNICVWNQRESWVSVVGEDFSLWRLFGVTWPLNTFISTLESSAHPELFAFFKLHEAWPAGLHNVCNTLDFNRMEDSCVLLCELFYSLGS